MTIKINRQKGYTLIYLLVIIFIFSAMFLPIINLLVTRTLLVRSSINREQALLIAEAGINYYQSTKNVPAVQDYIDIETQEIIGQFSLVITSPEEESAIMEIKSTGWTINNPDLKRTITVNYGLPSLTQYTYLSNQPVWIKKNEIINGKLQSNNGIRFDGESNSLVLSAKETYDCTDEQGCSPTETKNGIWGEVTQDVKNFWKFPVEKIDFSTFTESLANIKLTASSSGIYLPQTTEENYGYSLVFADNGTVAIRMVTGLESSPVGHDVNNLTRDEGTNYKSSNLVYVDSKNIPANGLIYVADNVWVEGIVKGKITVATPETIYIPDNIIYLKRDRNNILGLFAKKDIVISYDSPNELKIEAALLAQDGGVQIFYYPDNTKDNLEIYGSIITNDPWVWNWTNEFDEIISGYRETKIKHDNNLNLNSPPGFPHLSTNQKILEWKSN